MSHLWNPLATVEQLERKESYGQLPSELQDTVRYATARLTEAAGVLLRLPQGVAAQAIVVLYRFWLEEDMMTCQFSDASAASVYLMARMSASPRSLRSVTNVYAYLLSSSSPLSPSCNPSEPPDPQSFYLSEADYYTARMSLLQVETRILDAVGFNLHVALPHPLAITYLQTLDVFGASQPKGTGPRIAKRAIQYLNTALLSPQMLYLTHQPNALATAAIYLAARDEEVKLPESEWWQVFDTDREELGFLALGMKSLEGWVRTEVETWRVKGFVSRESVLSLQKQKGM